MEPSFPSARRRNGDSRRRRETDRIRPSHGQTEDLPARKGFGGLGSELTPSNTLETGIAWSTANADVATVSTAGLITSVKVGEVKIKLASTVNANVFTELVVTVVDDLIDTGSGTVDPGAAESRRM